MNWEYVTIFLRSRGLRVDRWYLTRDDGSTLHGLDTILNFFRQQGWELVSLVPESTSGTIFSFFTAQDARTLLAVFKRPTVQ